MSLHTPSGAMYTTKDLINMARMEYFGQYSPVIGRALSKLSALEEENKILKKRLEQIEMNDFNGKVHRLEDV
jgi:hypothetical protein